MKLLIAVAAVALIEVAPARAGLDVPGTVDQAIDPSSVSHGAAVRLIGTVQAEEPCRAGRDLVMEFRPVGSLDWDPAGSAVTGGTGVGQATVAGSERGAYRTRATAVSRDGAACQEATSAEVPIEVRAVVTAALDTSRPEAGGCARISVAVRPAKPGATVTVERATSEGWKAVADAVLDEDSRAVVPRCHGWEAIGRSIDLRAAWAGDEHHGADTSRMLTLDVVKAGWMKRIDRLTRRRKISVSVREEGAYLYRRRDGAARVPASNQKLLLSMALLDALGTSRRLNTVAAASTGENGVITGDLWLIGDGDPTVGREAIDRLAAEVDAAGITAVRGRVRGSTSPFSRDWFAPGWKSYFPRRYVALPTALTFEDNERRHRHISNPERRAAARLTRSLRRRGIPVDGPARSGAHPGGLTEVASVRSATLIGLVRHMATYSDNFEAEVLGKRLGLERSGPPGSISRGAAGIAAWATSHGVGVAARDASGLSYQNRVSASGVAVLLGAAEEQVWGQALRTALPGGGSGTLGRRLHGVPVRAKTGTLSGISALSGWVWLERRGTWAEFSILSRGLSKSRAIRIEDAIVRKLVAKGR